MRDLIIKQVGSFSPTKGNSNERSLKGEKSTFSAGDLVLVTHAVEHILGSKRSIKFSGKLLGYNEVGLKGRLWRVQSEAGKISEVWEEDLELKMKAKKFPLSFKELSGLNITFENVRDFSDFCALASCKEGVGFKKNHTYNVNFLGNKQEVMEGKPTSLSDGDVYVVHFDSVVDIETGTIRRTLFVKEKKLSYSLVLLEGDASVINLIDQALKGTNVEVKVKIASSAIKNLDPKEVIKTCSDRITVEF